MALVLDTVICCFFFQAEDGIRDLVRSRGLGDVYKRQVGGGAVVFDAGGDSAAGGSADGGRVALPGILLPWLSLIHI